MSHYMVGKRIPRVDSEIKVRGEARFTADLSLPGMLYGKFLRSPHAHARILNIDTSKAEKLLGVKAVVTGKRDALPYKWGVFAYTRDYQLLPIDRVRFIGEEVAGVAAVSEEIANEALELIKVEYEVLPAVFTIEEATKPGAILLHDDKPGNISSQVHIEEGDVDLALKQPYYVQEDRFSDEDESYCQLETYAVLVNFDSTGLDIWCPNAGPHVKARPLSIALGIPTSKVRLHKVFIGGHFGGRSEIAPADYITALLSRKARRPVKVVFNREEAFTSPRQVHSFISETKVGVDKNGVITAVDIKYILGGGAYASTGPIATSVPYQVWEERYRIPVARYDARTIYTNKPPRGMYPQHGRSVLAGLEMQLDMIAEKLGMDPKEIRIKNAVTPGYVTPTKSVIGSCALIDSIEQATRKAGWKEKKGKLPYGRGIGMSCSSVMVGFPMGIRGGSAAMIKFNEDGVATIVSGVVDNGQGNDSMVMQIASEELGLPLDKIELISADTGLTPSDQGAYSQASTIISGGAVKEAAADARRQLFEVAAKMLKTDAANLECKEGNIYVKGSPEKNTTIARAVRAALANNVTIMGKGYRWPTVDQSREWVENPKGQLATTYTFGACIAEVEVDTKTGKVKVLNMTAAHDCGYAINPMAVEQQMQRSAAASGIQDALFERHLWDGGQNLNANFLDYWFPTSLDVPNIDTIIIQSNDAFGPFGAKEGGLDIAMSMYGAVANAIHDATGVWVKKLPFTPDRVLEALEQAKKNG